MVEYKSPIEIALDREQYDKGYKQGYEDCQKEIEESLGLL